MIAEGQPAPDFELTSDGGERVHLSALRGKPVVLYFCPKDDTLVAWGPSAACNGKKFMSSKRSTFVIDADGKVVQAMLGIRPAGHAVQVLESLST